MTAATPRTQRSRARILALQALCALDALGEEFESELDEFLRDAENYDDLGWLRAPKASVLGFARELATGARRQRERCDALLLQSVTDWSLERMQPVDRNILRLGLYELLEQPGTPYPVVINEAIELARLFGGAESAAFVNGVLDAVRRKLEVAAREADHATD